MGDGEKRRQRKSKRDGGRIERERDRARGEVERESKRELVYKPSINAFIGFAAHTHVCVCALLCLPVRPGALCICMCVSARVGVRARGVCVHAYVLK